MVGCRNARSLLGHYTFALREAVVHTGGHVVSEREQILAALWAAPAPFPGEELCLSMHGLAYFLDLCWVQLLKK